MNPGRVKQVRELLGWTQTELAERTGLTQGLISQIESGRSSVTDEALAMISAATSFDEEWFRREPYEPLPEGTLRFRKKAAASERSSHQAVRRLEVCIEMITEMRLGLRLPPVSLVPRQAPSSDADIEAAAQDTREALGLSLTGPVGNVMRAAERAGVIFVGMNLDVAGHEGASVWPTFNSEPIIGYQIDSVGDRQRFTVAHELGHLMLHSCGSTQNSKDAELEAHRFAGAFLMPEEDAIEALTSPLTLTTLAHLKSSWGIAMSALIKRAMALQLITPERATSLYKQMSARRWSKVEPVTVNREQPRLFAELTRLRYDSNTRRMAAHFGVSPIIVRQLLGASTGDDQAASVVTLRRLG